MTIIGNLYLALTLLCPDEEAAVAVKDLELEAKLLDRQAEHTVDRQLDSIAWV